MSGEGRKVVFWGATGQARVLRELVESIGFELIALFDRDLAVAPPFADVPLRHGRDEFASWRRNVTHPLYALAAIGGDRGRDRIEVQTFLAQSGCTIPTVVHPTAFVAANASMGAGSQVLARAAVAVDATIGEACIINTAASVDHECTLGDGVHIAPGAVLAGNVVVGARTFIGMGAVVLPRVTIGADVTIGAGAVVTRDIPDGVVAFGLPAVIQSRK